MKNYSRIKKRLHRNLSIGATLIATSLVVSFGISANAVQPTILMGTTANFAVLAGSGISNTGATTISGTSGTDLGSSPTTSFTGDTLVTTTGSKYTAPAAAVDQAKTDLVVAYDDAAGRIPATTVTGDLGGQTLKPGVYNSASSIGLTGVLTLDAENDPAAVFIFQAGSTLTTASASSIALINGAQACNVFWQVGSSATFGTASSFVGTVLALTSITATTGASFNGQLLARNGAVTLGTNTIVHDACVTPTATTTPTPEATTVTGGELPNTDGINWGLPLALGLAIAALGVFGLLRSRRQS